MPALYGRDANGNDAYLNAAGSGTAGSPYSTIHDLVAFGLQSSQLEGSASADVVAAVSGYKVRVLGLALTADAACSLRFQTGGSGNLTPRLRVMSGDTVDLSNAMGLFETAIGDKLNVVLSGTANFGVLCSYRLV
jgi:hypothetical protein